MTQQSQSKRVTRVEVLVILFISLLILGVISSVFYYARTIYFRMRCGTNLTETCFALLIYSNDYDDNFPRAGGENSDWNSRISDWQAGDRYAAYDINSSDGSGGAASITSSFYLLVKYTEISPKTFICPGDKGVTEFKPADYGARSKKLADFWDFGAEPREHCSFSYHMPYCEYRLTTSSEPGMAVAADPNPWIGTKEETFEYMDLFNVIYSPYGTKEEINVGNTFTHKKLGQNVLFMDAHVGFEKQSFCGIDEDNIYTYWDGTDIRKGGFPMPTGCTPHDKLDSFLVNDGEGPKPTIKKKSR
jgi:hypothetical protein